MWFYIGRHSTETGHRAGGKAFVQDWVANQLDAGQASLWNAVNELRTADAHVEPVITEMKTEAKVLLHDGEVCLQDGKILLRDTTVYVVIIEGKPCACLRIAGEWIALAKLLVEHLRLNPP